MKQIVFLDLDNTLLDFHAGAKATIEEGFSLRGLPYDESVFPVFTATNLALWEALERGEMTKAELRECRWNLIFDKLHIVSDGHSFEEFFENGIANSAVPVPGAKELLRYLSERYRIYIMSNGFEATQKNRLKMAGMDGFISGMFVSDTVGAPKPEPAYFDFCFRALENPDKADTVLIGDSLTADILGGKQYGIDTIWFDRTGETPKKECTPDYTVRALDEITEIL